MEKKVVYVGCSLTYAGKRFKAQVEALKKKLEDNGICVVLKFIGLSDKNIPHDVYVHDIDLCVRKCDLLVAICDYPSIGLGYEMGTQGEARKKPTLAVAKAGRTVTKIVLDTRTPGYEFRYYKSLVDDVYNMVIEKLASLDSIQSV